MTIKSITVRTDGVTLSLLIWHFLKRQPIGYLEKVISFNPGLANTGVFLPIGTVVNFPLDDIPSVAKKRDLVRLWD